MFIYIYTHFSFYRAFSYLCHAWEVSRSIYLCACYHCFFTLCNAYVCIDEDENDDEMSKVRKTWQKKIDNNRTIDNNNNNTAKGKISFVAMRVGSHKCGCT